MMQWQNGFVGVSKATAFGWAQTPSNAASAPKPSVSRNALVMKVRSVPPLGKYLAVGVGSFLDY
jgi:hypothetical protein